MILVAGVLAAPLPTVNGDSGTWGTILNTFLGVSLASDGTLNSNVVGTAQITDGVITTSDISATAGITSGQIADGTITTDDIATDTIAAADIAAGAVGTSEIADGVITTTDISSSAGITSAQIADATIANADISTSAAIALSKLAAGTDGQIIVVGVSTTTVPAYATMSGDATLSNLGALAVSDDSHAHTASTISGLGTDDISGLSAADLNADFGDFTCTGSAAGCTVDANAVALGTDTTNNYVATVADSGAGIFTVSGSGSESATVTLAITADMIDGTELKDSLALDAATTITGTTAGVGLTITSNINAAALTVTNANVGGSVLSLTSSGGGTLLSAQGACYDGNLATCVLNDYAELYPASESVEQGSLVSIDDSKEDLFVKTTRKSYDTSVIGIVSTSPAIVIEGGAIKLMGGIYAHNPLKPAIAMAGRVPVKVTNENGPIKPGDLLVPSSTPGYAMRCPGRLECIGSVVGKALRPFKEKEGKVLALVINS
ncbi:hypothetical protein HZA97_01640 [Candidatus Woesearchaeota archaeon]|nr:hypothetical protein [Candidatus Woesearchaeota archaeon]